MSLFRFVLVALALILSTLVAVSAERMALVIGNSSYSHLPSLSTPAADAEAIGGALERIGFAVTRKGDLDKSAMMAALSGLQTDAAEAKIVVVYFAGHGAATGGEQYLIPSDANLAIAPDTKAQAVSLETVLKAVSDVKGVAIVLVDTGRESPFPAAPGGVPSGIAAAGEPKNLIVGFATSPGGRTVNGSTNSPYARALLAHLETPGLEVVDLMRKVRDQVVADTKGEQTPFFVGTLSGESIFLVPAK